jgi:hypothetical protein
MTAKKRAQAQSRATRSKTKKALTEEELRAAAGGRAAPELPIVRPRTIEVVLRSGPLSPQIMRIVAMKPRTGSL